MELIPKLRDMLGAFLFRGDDVFKTLDVLSGGEKSRLALLQLLLRPVNLLILDEPTNHLDLHSKDVLLNALKDFGGTVVFVSHDRGFIEDLATRVIELRPPLEDGTETGWLGRARNFPGSYSYYLERLESENQGTVAVQENVQEKNRQSAAAKSRTEEKTGTLRYEEQKRLKNERRKLEREEERLMTEIAQAEEEKEKLKEELSLPHIYSDMQKSRSVQEKIENLEQKIQELTEAWEQVSSDLEQSQG